MKHTDFRSLVHDIKRKEQQELCRALEAHGGNYSWWDTKEECFVEDEHPIIAVNVNSMFPNPTDVEIRSVSVNNGFLTFVGEDKESGELVSFQPGDVFAGHLSHIIDLIPETKETGDVSATSENIPVSVFVSRQELVDIGFDASDVSVKDMENMAMWMRDQYYQYDFEADLKMAAERLSIPRLSGKYDDWFDNLDFASLEKVTGLVRSDYLPDDGYQDFVDDCKDWWEDLTLNQKKEIYDNNS